MTKKHVELKFEDAIAAELVSMGGYAPGDAADYNVATAELKNPLSGQTVEDAKRQYKTAHVFDEPGPSGRAPFHEYTMRQAFDKYISQKGYRDIKTLKSFNMFSTRPSKG